MKLIDQLIDYQKSNVVNLEVVTRFINFINNNSNCFDRSCLSGHLTASALVLSPDLQSVLLIKHRKLNKWLQPGGHADGDRDLLEVALKEVAEETSIIKFKEVRSNIFDIDIHLIPEFNNIPEHYHYDVRFLLIAEDLIIEGNSESLDMNWIKISEIQEYTKEESILRMIDKLTVYGKGS